MALPRFRTTTALLCLFAALIPAGPGAAAVPDSLSVAIMTTLTGSRAFAGQDMVDGFSLGIRHAGGRLGNLDVAVEVINDHLEPQAAAVAAHELAARPKGQRPHMVLGGLRPEIVAAMAGPLTKANILTFSLAALPNTLAGASCSPYLFGLGMPDGALAAALAAHLATAIEGDVWLSVPAGHRADGAADTLRQALSGRVLGNGAASPGQLDFHDEIKRIRAAKPQALVTFHTGGTQVSLIRQLARTAETAPIPVYGLAQGFEPQHLGAIAGHGKLFSLGTWSETIDTPQNRRFVEDFEEEFGRLPSFHAAQAYETALLVDTALKAVEGNIVGNDSNFQNALRKAEFMALDGSFRFASNQVAVQNVHLRQVAPGPRGRVVNVARQVLGGEWTDPQAAACNANP